jgi:hypothetical protein
MLLKETELPQIKWANKMKAEVQTEKVNKKCETFTRKTLKLPGNRLLGHTRHPTFEATSRSVQLLLLPSYGRTPLLQPKRSKATETKRAPVPYLQPVKSNLLHDNLLASHSSLLCLYVLTTSVQSAAQWRTAVDTAATTSLRDVYLHRAAVTSSAVPAHKHCSCSFGTPSV